MFTLLKLFIGFISAYDVYLSIKFRDVLFDLEQNPVGKMLMEMDNGEVALFMGLKFAGTILSLEILTWLYFRDKTMAWWVGSGVAVFQAFLLIYLETGFEFFS